MHGTLILEIPRIVIEIAINSVKQDDTHTNRTSHFSGPTIEDKDCKNLSIIELSR